jgi:type III restriction enzyme
MRLPFGAYTDVEILDTLEVIAHERYQELLRKAGVLNEAFVDYRTRAVLKQNSQGQQVAVRETVPTEAPPIIASTEEEAPPATTTATSASASDVFDNEPAPVVTALDDRSQQVAKAALKMKQPVMKNPAAPTVMVPVLRMSAVESSFSLADITETDAFRRLARSLASDPEGELNRMLLGARVVTGRDGIRRTQLVPTTAADRVRSNPTLFPIDELREQLTEIVLGSSAVPARKNQRTAFQPLLEAFIEGLGSDAQTVLSANLERAGARLVSLVEQEQRRFMAKPSYQEVVELKAFDPTRVTDREVSDDRYTKFARSEAYQGWKRSMFDLVWFDSSTERAAANMVDESDDVAWWVRLHINDIPILWSSGGNQYNPDLLVIEQDGTHWIVEVKMDKDMGTDAVQGKRDAAKRWANHVTADASVDKPWKYLLVSESDVATARGSWRALRQLAG